MLTEERFVNVFRIEVPLFDLICDRTTRLQYLLPAAIVRRNRKANTLITRRLLHRTVYLLLKRLW